MKVIHLSNIKKEIHNEPILKNINLDISGSFGLLGPNGAGKTTLIRILCTLIQPTEGEIYTDEHLNWKDINKVKENIGYLPQSFTFFKSATVIKSLQYIARLKGIKKSDIDKQINRVLKETNLEEQKRKKIKHLSGGMLRRLGIAQALLGDPQLIIVDEPTVGLDIEERVRFRQLLRKLGGKRTILISSHIVDDIETTCDSICILKGGEVLINGQLSSLLHSIEGKIREIGIPKPEIDEFQGEIISLKEDGNEYKVRYFSDSNDLGVSVKPTLEDLYIYMIKKGNTDEEL